MTFYETLTAAINDFIKYGFDSPDRLEYWSKKLRNTLVNSLIDENSLKNAVEKALNTAYHRLVTKGKLVNKYVDRFTIDRLKPKMQEELQRRIMVSARLIELNRNETVNTVLKRFSGWASSIPEGGSKAVDKLEEKKAIRKSIVKIPYEQRRVIIDQTHKLIANINDIVAIDKGAIAAEWNSHWRESGYDYREDHKERSDKIYLVRGSWAVDKGYVKPADGYTDEITSPGEEVYCRCFYRYIYTLQKLPEEMLTTKGKTAIQSGKTQ